MAAIDYKQEIMAAIDKLDTEHQRRVLEFARTLSRPKGTPGKLAVQYAREINISPEDLAEMQQAIEEAIEVVEDFPEVDFDE